MVPTLPVAQAGAIFQPKHSLFAINQEEFTIM